MPIGEPDKSSDPPPPDASFTPGGIQNHQDDVVIAVMGCTGTGKSSFIRLVSGDPSVRIGEGLESETSEIQVVRFIDCSGLNVVIIDTPGFDDSHTSGDSDVVILKNIAAFLLEFYDDNRKLNGIIYLHRITDARFGGLSNRNLQILAGLCGTQNFKNVIVLTTFWDRIDEEVGAMRESQLKSRFFKALVDGGACFMRHNRTMEIARDVFNHIFRLPPTNVQIQEEIRLKGKSLQETAAGSVLAAELEQLKVQHQEEIKNLEHALKKEAEESGKMIQYEMETLLQQFTRREREMLELRQGLAAAKPSSMKVPLHRLTAASTTGPRLRLPPVSMSTINDNFDPSVAPEPPSKTVPIYASALLPTGDDEFVPSAVPEPSSVTQLLFRLPETSVLLEDLD